jgi:hypothetical protein
MAVEKLLLAMDASAQHLVPSSLRLISRVAIEDRQTTS